MPKIFSKTLNVPADAIDMNRHLNNLAYLRWMQDIAVEHSAAQGWPVRRYLETGTTWVVRSHFIEYLRPAFAGDNIAVHTWVSAMGESSSPRRYLFARNGDDHILARAETQWVYVDLASGRPLRIPGELGTAFAILPSEDEVVRELGLRPVGTEAADTGG